MYLCTLSLNVNQTLLVAGWRERLPTRTQQRGGNGYSRVRLIKAVPQQKTSAPAKSNHI